MTAETVPIEEPKRKTYVVERPRFPLVFKLFGMTAVLILIVIGLAVGITIERANRIARQTVDTSISNAAKLFKEFERQRLGRLSLGAQFEGKDPYFVAYMQHAMNPESTASGPAPSGTASQPGAPAPVQPGAAAAPQPAATNDADILDQIVQRKEQLGSDLMMMADDQGHLLARTDAPALSGEKMEDLYETIPLVRKIVEDPTLPAVTGVIATGNRLYHAAIAPLTLGANNVRVGYLINA